MLHTRSCTNRFKSNIIRFLLTSPRISKYVCDVYFLINEHYPYLWGNFDHLGICILIKFNF